MKTVYELQNQHFEKIEKCIQSSVHRLHFESCHNMITTFGKVFKECFGTSTYQNRLTYLLMHQKEYYA